jgi:hypothetical protein
MFPNATDGLQAALQPAGAAPAGWPSSWGRFWDMVVRAAVAAVIALLAAGCGDETRSDDGDRRQAAITISVVIAPSGVSTSPRRRFSAGTIELLASNQTATSRSLELRSRRLAAGGSSLVQRTGPIPPGGTTTLTAAVDEGTYRVSAPGSGIAPSQIVIGPPRANAIDRLLQP